MSENILLSRNPYSVSKASLDFLASIEEELLLKWYYLALVEAMPLEQVEAHFEGEKTVESFKELRTKYLTEKFQDTDIKEHWKKAITSCNAALIESKKLKAALQAKESMEQEGAEKKIAILEEECHRLKSQLEKAQEENFIKMEQIEIQKKELLQLNKERMKSREVVASVPSTSSAHSLWQRLRKKEKQGITKELFMERYITTDAYTADQKNFFLDCIEEGIPLSDIEAFAVVGMDVEYMKRLKIIYQRRNSNNEN